MVSPIVKMPNTEKHSGVSGIPTQLLVLHSGESPLRGGYAQSLTQWANVPLSQGGPEASWHWFVDPIAIVSMVDPNFAAWHASEANPMSEGFEQSGYARYTRAEWLTAEGMKQIDNLAWIMAQRAKANGIPAIWLTTAQVNAITSGRDRTTKGLCTHRQIDPETRTDPGDHYPFDVLTARINAYMGGAATVPQGTTTPKENTLSAAEVAKINAHTTAEANRVIEYVGQVMVSGYTVGRGENAQKFPGATKVDIVNQQLIKTVIGLLQTPGMTAEQITEAVTKGMKEGVDVFIGGKPV